MFNQDQSNCCLDVMLVWSVERVAGSRPLKTFLSYSTLSTSTSIQRAVLLHSVAPPNTPQRCGWSATIWNKKPSYFWQTSVMLLRASRGLS